MRAHELIQEFSTTDPGIDRYLKNRGYKKLGAGVDQTAYLEPGTGHVLKIFGTQCSGGDENPQLSADQLMFKTYAEFCERNQNNPYLPRIYGWETFSFPTKPGRSARDEFFKDIRKPAEGKNCLYLQIRTEPLQRFDNQFYSLFSDMAEAVQEGDSFQTFHRDMSEGPWEASNRWYRSITDNPQSIARMQGLYDTMSKLFDIGEQNGWTWDLHGDNIMRRTDGTPVITDPWVV